MPLIIVDRSRLRLTGYGIIEKDGSKLRCTVDAGTIRTKLKDARSLEAYFCWCWKPVKFAWSLLKLRSGAKSYGFLEPRLCLLKLVFPVQAPWSCYSLFSEFRFTICFFF